MTQPTDQVAKSQAALLPTAPPSYWGVGPRIGLGTLLHFVIAIALDWWTCPFFTISLISPQTASVTGIIMLIAGVALYLLTTIHLQRARQQQKLITTGPYRIVRHPLYSIGLLLLCPGVCLLLHSWLLLTTPLTMAILMRMLIPKEERTLVQMFGDAYRDYQKCVPMFWPLRWW